VGGSGGGEGECEGNGVNEEIRSKERTQKREGQNRRGEGVERGYVLPKTSKNIVG